MGRGEAGPLKVRRAKRSPRTAEPPGGNLVVPTEENELNYS